MDVTGGGLKAPPEVCVKPGLQGHGSFRPNIRQVAWGPVQPRPVPPGTAI